ncbi:MAG: TonB-dependent receptor [Polyangiaceae bacterium]
MRTTQAISLLALLLVAPLARAEEGGELEALLEEKVVTSASKAAETAQSAPATAITITAEELSRHGIRSVAEAVRYLVPGATVEETSRGSFGSRGVLLGNDQSAHVLVLVDGHSVNNEIDGGTDLGPAFGVPIELIDHIEVVLGPGSVLYGSAAMFGVVNVVSKRAENFRGVQLGADAELSHQYRAFAGAGAELDLPGKKLEITLGVEHVRLDDPLSIPDQYVGNDAFTGTPLKTRVDGSRNGIWGGTWNHNFSHHSAAYLRAARGDWLLTTRAGTRESNDPIQLFDFDNPDTGYHDRWLALGLTYQKRVLAPLELKLRLYGNEHRRGFSWRSSAAQYCLPGQSMGCHIDTDSGAEWAGAEAQAHIDWMGSWAQTTLLGVDGRVRNQQMVGNITDAVTGNNPGSVSYISRIDEVLGAYAEHIARPARSLTVNLGARLDTSSSGDTALSPRAALVYEPWHGNVLKAVYSSAFNMPPAYTEAYALPLLVVPAGKLEHERVRSFELSMEQRFGWHTLRTNLFYAHWENMIELMPLSADELSREKAAGRLLAFVPQGAQFRNATTIESYGGSASVEGMLESRQLRYALSVSESFARRSDGEQRTQILGAPQLQASARISYDFAGGFPTLGLAALGTNRVLTYGTERNGYATPPTIAPRVTALASATGAMPGLPQLRYRLGVSLASSGDSPQGIGIIKHATAANPNPVLFPLRTFTLLGGVSYTFD